MSKYRVHQCLDSEISEGYVWITDKNILASRGVIKIVRTDIFPCPVIFCDGLYCDENYLKKRTKIKDAVKNDKERGIESVILSAYYRSKLDINESGDNSSVVKLYVSSVGYFNFVDRIAACIQHPQVGVRMAAWIGICGLIIGVVSINADLTVFTNMLCNKCIFFMGLLISVIATALIFLFRYSIEYLMLLILIFVGVFSCFSKVL